MRSNVKRWVVACTVVATAACTKETRDPVPDCAPAAASTPTAVASAPAPAEGNRKARLRIKAIEGGGFELHEDAIVGLFATSLERVQVERAEGGGYRLLEVPPDSGLFEAGLRSGDTVISIDDVKLDSADALYRAHTLAKRAPLVLLSLRRDGADLRIPYLIKRTPARKPHDEGDKGDNDAKLTPIGPEATAEMVAKAKAAIEKRSETHLRIKRSLRDELLDNQATWMRHVRVVPKAKDGKVIGLRLAGIRKDSLFDLLGFRNGDVLMKINGFDISSPQKALEAYAELRKTEELIVELVRDGAPLKITFELV